MPRYSRTEYVDPGPIKPLNSLLWNWIWLNRLMVKTWRGIDCPWWYNERASLSVFAGAIWHSDGIALEEYATRKRKHEGQFLGRCDLYFKIGSKEYIAETKQCWANIGSRVENYSKPIHKNLRNACKGARENRPEATNNEELLGIVFATPRIPQSDSDYVGKRILEWQRELIMFAERKCAFAWIFPTATWVLKAKDDNYIYPGTAIIIKRAGRV